MEPFQLEYTLQKAISPPIYDFFGGSTGKMLPECPWLVKLQATALELELLHRLNLQPQDEMSHKGAGTSLLHIFLAG